MDKRTLGRTGRTVSVVGLGTWQLGADWGDVSESDATAVLDAAAEEGVTFFDTADVYGDGRSETVIGRFLADNPNSGITVATKMGRRVDQVPENYVLDNFRAWTDRSRRNLGVDRLDLVQLHCPPTAVYDDDALYDALDTLVEEGWRRGIRRQRREGRGGAGSDPAPARRDRADHRQRLPPQAAGGGLPASAAAAGVGIIVRVPLASGLLSGKYDESTSFAKDDHRSFNRDGSAFDVGETFSGVDYETGLRAASAFGSLVDEHAPEGLTSAQAAIAWLWQHEEVSTVIPGARSVEQARANAEAGRAAPLGEAFDDGVRRIYDELLREAIHPRW